MELTSYEQAIDELDNRYGMVLRDESAPGRPVIEVNLERSSASDAVATLLKHIPEVRNLILDHSLVTNKVMEVLEFLPGLGQLVISDTAITDDGMQQLIHTPKLEELSLGAGISDRGLSFVSKLSNLRVLHISGTQITDVGMKAIRGLKQLSVIMLSPRQVTRASLEHLKTLPNLSTINLTDTNSLSDATVVQIKDSLPSVQVEC